MAAASSESTRDVVALQQALEAAQEKIAELEDKLESAERVQQAGTVLLIAALVHRLGDEVVLANDEMGAITGELQSYETFGGRVFKLVPGDEESADEDDEEVEPVSHDD